MPKVDLPTCILGRLTFPTCAFHFSNQTGTLLLATRMCGSVFSWRSAPSDGLFAVKYFCAPRPLVAILKIHLRHSAMV